MFRGNEMSRTVLDSTIAVRAEGLSKKYKLGSITRHTLVEEVEYLFHKLMGRDPRQHMTKMVTGTRDQLTGTENQAQEFWALRDVSFTVKRGDIVGVIGHNGSGKSTLLKLLTRITEPTEGEAYIYGRVASLLEVGTGFHPDLSGRENVYLNGTLLGMKRAEITRKLPEITAFSELEGFMDTPVKRYSSGMYVRLAFAVAAHLEPEILLVDEVLAVGDAAFQRKCIGKMSEVASGGRTVFFVSHNLAAVESLCTRAILLKNGTCIAQGDTRDVLATYTQTSDIATGYVDLQQREKRGTGTVRVLSFQLQDMKGNRLNTIPCGSAVRFSYCVENLTDAPLKGFHLDVGLDNPMGARICWMSTMMDVSLSDTLPKGKSMITFKFDKFALTPGSYQLSALCFAKGEHADIVDRAGQLEVIPADFYGTGKSVPKSQGHVLLDYHASLTFMQNQE